MYGIDILYALCYAQADVMYHTIDDLDEKTEEKLIKHLSSATAFAIKTIRKNDIDKEDEK